MSEHSTFWLLYGQHGATMSFDKFCAEFFPSLQPTTIKKKCPDIPTPVNGVMDVRDVAAWWASHLSAPATDRPGSVLTKQVADDWLRAAMASRTQLDQPTIYFLFSGGEVVYVGKSINAIARLNTHASRTEKVFDSFAMIACDGALIDETEARIISALCPRYNTQYADRLMV